ncbi:MAG: hypothetical protein Q7S03_03660 [bacterium]|nr:hypothetical protein [bacterium]
MPEEVTDRPPLYLELRDQALLSHEDLRRRSIEIDNLSPAKVARFFQESRRMSSDIKEELEGKLPDYPVEKIEAMLDLYFGFARLQPGTLLERDAHLTESEKRVSALIQHGLVHQIIYASSESADPAYVEAVYYLFRSSVRLVEKMDKVQATNLNLCWGGVKNEVALARALLDNGYRVFVPDYLQGDVPDDEDEILQFDIRRGVDVMAVNKFGTVFLLDAKGRKYKTREGERVISLSPDVVAFNLWNAQITGATEPLIRQCISKIEPKPQGIFKAAIALKDPGEETEGGRRVCKFCYQDLRAEETVWTRQRQILSEFGSLNAGIDRNISATLRELEALARSGNIPRTQMSPLSPFKDRELPLKGGLVDVA